MDSVKKQGSQPQVIPGQPTPPAIGAKDSRLNLAEGRPGMADPISPSVPRAGPSVKGNARVNAIMAEAQAALLKGDAQKAGDLFAEATRLATLPPDAES